MTIYVGTLSFHAEPEDLPDLFSQYTEVRQNSFVSIAIRAVIACFVLVSSNPMLPNKSRWMTSRTWNGWDA